MKFIEKKNETLAEKVAQLPSERKQEMRILIDYFRKLQDFLLGQMKYYHISPEKLKKVGHFDKNVKNLFADRVYEANYLTRGSLGITLILYERDKQNFLPAAHHQEKPHQALDFAYALAKFKAELWLSDDFEDLVPALAHEYYGIAHKGSISLISTLYQEERKKGNH